MKHLTISVLATLTILLAPASALAQESLKARIARIERDFGVSFVYASSLPLESRQAAGSGDGRDLAGVLKESFEGTGISYEVRRKNVILKPAAVKAVRKHTVCGHITDAADGETLIGAAVVSYGNGGSPVGTVTNNYGFYSITLPEGDISFKYNLLGYGSEKREFTLARDTVVNIALEPTRDSIATAVITSPNDWRRYPCPNLRQIDSIYKAGIDTAGYIESMMKDWHYSIEEFRKWGLYDFNPADSKHMMLRVRLIKEADGSLRFIPEGISAQFDVVYAGKEGLPRFLIGRHDQRILEPDGSARIEKLIEVEHPPWSFNNKSFRKICEQNPDIILSCFIDPVKRCLFFIKDGQLFFQWNNGYKSFAGKAYRWDEAMKKYEIREFLINLSEYFSRKNLPPDISEFQIPVLCM